MTANYEYSGRNRENLLLQNQIPLSKQPKTFPVFFLVVVVAFLESTLNCIVLKKKNEPHRSGIFEVIDSERCTYLNA